MNIRSGTLLVKIYFFIARCCSPLAYLFLLYRAKSGKEDLYRLKERLGVTQRIRPSGPLVWFHAASVGELLSLITLLEILPSNLPSYSVLVTTGTITSSKIATQRLPESAIHQYAPLDLPFSVKRFLNHWKPNLAVRVESELWPVQIEYLRSKNIPSLLINARLSEKSYLRWARISGLAERLLGAFQVILVQSPQDEIRISSFGEFNIKFVQNLKAASAPLPVDEENLSRIRDKVYGRPIWALASTHDGEESIAVKTHKILEKKYPKILTILIPRHPERGLLIAKKLKKSGLSVGLRSQGDEPDENIGIYVVDTLGELGLWYRIALLAVISGSFVDYGGHNPLEAAMLKKPILFGPYIGNFEKICYELIGVGGAISTTDLALSNDVSRLLEDDGVRDKIANAAFVYAQDQKNKAFSIGEVVAPWFRELT